MNQRQFALFLAFYFYLLHMSAANDAQIVVLLSCLIQIRALQGQVLILNQRRRRRRGRRVPLSQSGKFDRKPGFMTSRDKTTQVFEMKSEM